jgi:hypothetical protein
MDLHWYSLWRSGSDEALWEHAVPLVVGGEEILAPGPTHQLLLVSVHGADWATNTPLRAVADATAVIRAGEVDWELLVAEAKERRLTLVLGSQLEYLRDVVDVPVPDEVLRRLREAHSPLFERVGFRRTTRPFGPSTAFWMLWERQRRLKRQRPPGPPPAGLLRSFYEFLSLNWGVEGPGQFARRAGLAALRFANRRLSAVKAATRARLA